MSGKTNAWLQVDVPPQTAEQLAVHARRLHRTTRAQVRLLIETFVNEQHAETAANGDAPPTPKT